MIENEKIDVISYDQINSILMQLRNSNRINDYQLSVLQKYYLEHPVYNNVDGLKKLSTDISRIATSINSVSDDNVEVIDLYNSNDDYVIQSNNISSPNTNQFYNVNNVQSDSNNYIQQELFILKGESPNAIISLTEIPHQYILSHDGEDDKYVKVNGANGIYQIVNVNPMDNQNDGNIYGNQKSLGSHPALGNISWSRNSETNDSERVSNENKQAAFTNVLFFIFLSGLSIGIVFMAILNFFVR